MKTVMLSIRSPPFGEAGMSFWEGVVDATQLVCKYKTGGRAMRYDRATSNGGVMGISELGDGGGGFCPPDGVQLDLNMAFRPKIPVSITCTRHCPAGPESETVNVDLDVVVINFELPIVLESKMAAKRLALMAGSSLVSGPIGAAATTAATIYDILNLIDRSTEI